MTKIIQLVIYIRVGAYNINELIKLVMKTPPNYYVRILNIIEGKDGNILSIQYDLFPENAPVEETELNIVLCHSY